MTPEDLRELLKSRGVSAKEQAVQSGVQFRCPDGEVFVVYDTGTCVAQGKMATDLSRFVQECGAKKGGDRTAALRPPGPVFIVHGHDRAARDELELLVRRMGLEPIVLANLAAQGDTIIEKLEHYLVEHKVGFACVLLTPDDEGHRAGHPKESRPRARQNVVLELGMVLAALGRRRVAILRKESVEDPSDIAGLLWIGFKDNVSEVASKLFKELTEAGYSPKADGL